MQVLVTVEALFVGTVSIKLFGGVTVAVLAKAVAAVDGSTVPVIVNVAVAFLGTVTSVLMVLEPEVAPEAPPE